MNFKKNKLKEDNLIVCPNCIAIFNKHPGKCPYCKNVIPEETKEEPQKENIEENNGSINNEEMTLQDNIYTEEQSEPKEENYNEYKFEEKEEEVEGTKKDTITPMKETQIKKTHAIIITGLIISAIVITSVFTIFAPKDNQEEPVTPETNTVQQEVPKNQNTMQGSEKLDINNEIYNDINIYRTAVDMYSMKTTSGVSLPALEVNGQQAYILIGEFRNKDGSVFQDPTGEPFYIIDDSKLKPQYIQTSSNYAIKLQELGLSNGGDVSQYILQLQTDSAKPMIDYKNKKVLFCVGANTRTIIAVTVSMQYGMPQFIGIR